MREIQLERQYSTSFLDLCHCYGSRFNSPYTTHVRSQDTLFRRLDLETLCLYSVKLQRKTRKSFPRWLPGKLAAVRDTYVLEQSIIDPVGRVLYSASRNLDHRANADGIEWQALRELGPDSCAQDCPTERTLTC